MSKENHCKSNTGYNFTYLWRWCLLAVETFYGLKQYMAFSQTALLLEAAVPAVQQSPALHHRATKTSAIWRDLAAWCNPSEQTPNHSREKEEKYGEIKRRAQMLHCRLMLIILMQGQEKKCSVNQMCGGSDSHGETPGRGAVSPLDGTETNNSSSHQRCRLFLHCVCATSQCGCLVISLR